MITFVFLCAGYSELFAQPASLKDAIRKYNNERASEDTSTSTNSTSLNNGKQRIAIFFVATHQFNYYTQLPQEDHLFDYLMESFYYVYDCSCEFGNYDIIAVLAGKLLTRENVIKVFDLVRKQSKPGDDIFIYWNGHGGTGLPALSEKERDPYDEFLVLYDTTNNADRDPAVSIRKTAIVDDDMGELIASLKGRRVVALFETCHSGGLQERPANQNEARSFSDYRPAVLTATTFTQFAAMNPFRNGVAIPKTHENNKRFMEAYSTFSKRNAASSAPSSVTPSSSMETIILQQLNLKGAKSAPNSRNFRFFSHALEKSKDISGSQPDLDVLFACKEEQVARAGMMFKDNEGKIRSITLNPLAFAYCWAMITASKEKRTLSFEQLVPIFQDVLTTYIDTYKEVNPDAKEPFEQAPQVIMNLKDAWLLPPKNN